MPFSDKGTQKFAGNGLNPLQNPTSVNTPYLKKPPRLWLDQHSENPGYAYAVLVLSNTYNIIQKTEVTTARPNAFPIVSK